MACAPSLFAVCVPQIEAADVESHDIELNRYVPRILVEYCVRTAISQNGIVKQKVQSTFQPHPSHLNLTVTVVCVNVCCGTLLHRAGLHWQMDVSNVNPAYMMAVKSSTGGGAFEFGNKKRKSSVTQRTLRIVGSVQVTRYTRSGVVLNEPGSSHSKCDSCLSS